KEVREAIQTGYVFMHPRNRILQPVSVIAIHTPAQSREAMQLEGNDRLNHDGGDILNYITGFSNIAKSPAFGSDPVFRGFKHEQLNIVIDGVTSAIAACPNRMDPPTSQIAPNMMSHIEVLKGPHSLRFGNSFGATVNFVSEVPQEGTTGIRGRIASRYESNGSVTRNEAMLGWGAQKVNLQLFGSWARGNDYQTGNGDEIPAGFTRGSAGTQIHWGISDRQELALSATRNFARDVDFPALAMDLRSDDTWLFSARHKVTLKPGEEWTWSTSLFGSLVDHYMDNLSRDIVPRTINASTPAKTQSYGGRTESAMRLNSGKLFAGMDLRHEAADGERIREFLTGPNAGKSMKDNAWQGSHITKYALFAEYQVNAGLYKLVFSGRAELNRSGLDNPDGGFVQQYQTTDATQINPSFSIGATRDFGQNLFTGIWIGRASRSGSLTERYINYFAVGLDPYELLGNPNLDPEINKQADWHLSFTTEKFRISTDVFASLLGNHISSVIRPNLTPKLPASPGVRQYTNIGDAFKTGFEINTSHQISRKVAHDLAFFWTYGQDMETDEPLPEIPPLEFRYRLRTDWTQDFHSLVSLRHATSQKRISKSFGERETPAFTLVDFSLGYNIAKKIMMNAGIRNLLNETYHEHLNRSMAGTAGMPFHEPGRTADFALVIQF
ncbi:MAG TPA: TonB-dependent receptor, partial [Prolixibacteraceae bacterium]|nr:TonB-dependent receptor [Prolixibacteraceae bacterium]